jgi:hypothetical protein
MSIHLPHPRDAVLVFLISTLLLILPVSAAPGVVYAQANGSISLSFLELSDFPSIQFSLQAYDNNGKPLENLLPGDIQIIEDGEPQAVASLDLLQPGLQMTVAINGSPIFTNHYAGLTYSDRIIQSLMNWSQNALPTGQDDFSLISNDGMLLTHAGDPEQLYDTMTTYQPDFLSSKPTLASLSMALDLATDPLPDSQMKRAILYITPLPDALSNEVLPNLTDRAVQLNARVFIWLVAPGYALESAEATPLRNLADRTGGVLYQYNGEEDFPDPEQYLAPLRSIFQVSYDSRICSSGQHHLQVNITRPEFSSSSNVLDFSLDIFPPQPVFLNPPAQVNRSWTEGSPSVLTPDSLSIQVIIQFPDNHIRPIVRSSLYIDDEKVGENTQPPFDRFDWNLSGYMDSAQHSMRVEVEDTLGMSSSTIETLVELSVQQKIQPWWSELFSKNGAAVLVALFLAATVLTLLIVFAGRRTLFTALRHRGPAKNDPLTQPVGIRGERKRNQASATTSVPTIRRDQEEISAPAQLVSQVKGGNSLSGRVITLNHKEITLGKDPQQSMCVLDCPSLEPLHARILQDPDGDYRLIDENTIAGTWRNYNPVPPAGVVLVHGDIIHFATMAFRFEMRQPKQVFVVKINSPVDEES